MLNVLPCKVKIAKSLTLPFLRYQLDYTSTSFFLHYNYLPLTVFKFLLAYKTKFSVFLAHLAKTISPVFINSILQRLLKQRLSPSFDLCTLYFIKTKSGFEVISISIFSPTENEEDILEH